MGLGYPTDHHMTVEAIHWARMATKEDTSTATILIINHNNWTPQQIALTQNGGIHTLATIPPHTIQYNPTPEWPKYYQYIEPSLTSIICVHNQSHPTINLQTPQELTKILTITTSTQINTSFINPTSANYHVKFSTKWKNAPINNNTPPPQTTIPQITLPDKYYHQHHHKYHPQQCIYTDGSFIPPTKNSEGQIVGDTAGFGEYNPNKNICIAEPLLRDQNILRAELNAILIAIQTIQTTQTNTHIYTDSLNNIYLISNHIQHPTSQHHHPDKLLIAAIIHQINWTPHLIQIHKVWAHTCIIGNNTVDTLANEGALKEKPNATPHKHIAHATPYWSASCPIATRDDAIRNMQTFVTKAHNHRQVRTTQHKYPYIEEWLSNDQINQKLSKHFWKSNKIS